MTSRLYGCLLLLGAFEMTEALAEPETRTLAIKDSVLETVRPSQQPVYPGYTVTLQITGQIDANHEQWEEDECHWFDVFKWGCTKVRRHRSHYQPQSEVGVVFQLVDAQGDAYLGGTPRGHAEDASRYTSDPLRGLVPGSSGEGWKYDAQANLSTLTLTLESDPGRANALLEPAIIKGIVGDRVASSGIPVTRDDCSRFRTCSEGSLAVVVTDITTQRRVQLVADYLKQRRDPAKVASERLVDPILARQHPDELAAILLEYISKFATSVNEHGKLLRFAVDNIKGGSPTTSSKLSRTLVNHQIATGELGTALKTIQEKITEQAPEFNDLETKSSTIPVAKAVEYAGWLTAAARIHMKLNEGVLQSDVDRAIGLLRTARDVLTQVIHNRDNNAVYGARQDVAAISVTLARLLSATLLPAGMEEATRILTVARYYYPQEHPGSLLAGSPITPSFVVAKSGTAGNTPRPVILPSAPGRWIAEPGDVQDEAWFMFNENIGRHALVTLEGGQALTRYLPEIPAGVRQVFAQKWAVWIAPNGDIWRADPGQAEAVQRFKAADNSPRATVLDAGGQVAMVVEPSGDFVLVDLQDAGGEHRGELADGQPEDGQLFAVGADQFLLAWREGAQLKSSLIDLRVPDQPIITEGANLPLPDELAAPAAIDIQIHRSSTREQLAALIRSQYRAWRASLSSTPTLQALPELGYPPQRVWRSKEGWLFARNDQASSKLHQVSYKPNETAMLTVDFPEPVSLDRGALITPAGATSQWMLMTDVNPTPALSLANLARLDASAVDIKLDANQVNGLQRTGLGNVHVINESVVVVEHPLARTLRLYDTANPKLSMTLQAHTPAGQQVILGAIAGSGAMLLLDQQSDGTVTLVRKLEYTSQFFNDTWELTTQDCVADGCTADVRSTEGGTVIPSTWQRLPGASPERDGFVELISTPVGGWTALPLTPEADWEIKIRAHTPDETMQYTTVRVHKPEDYLGSVRNAQDQLYALIRNGDQLQAVAWEDGATVTLHEGLAQGAVRLFPGREGSGVVSIRSGTPPQSLTLILYGFNATGRPVALGCSNCAALQAQFAEAKDLEVKADLDLVTARQGQCLQVAQLQKLGPKVSEPLLKTVSLIDGAPVYVTGLPMDDSVQLRVLVPVTGQSTIINRLGGGESIKSCTTSDMQPAAGPQSAQVSAK